MAVVAFGVASCGMYGLLKFCEKVLIKKGISIEELNEF